MIEPHRVRRYLEDKFRDDLGLVRSVMHRLAKSYQPRELADTASHLYERFRPAIPEGAGRSEGGLGFECDLGAFEDLKAEQRGLASMPEIAIASPRECASADRRPPARTCLVGHIKFKTSRSATAQSAPFSSDLRYAPRDGRSITP